MKKLVSLAAALCLMFSLSTCARAKPEPEPDYLGEMLRFAATGDISAGHQVEQQLIMSAEDGKYSGPQPDFDELYMLSRAISCQFGNSRYSDELRLCAGELILNRLASPEYPDTLKGVILQKEKSPCSQDAFEACLCPGAASAEAAMRLLLGERMLGPTVVEQSSERREGVYAMFCNELMGNVYFYESSNPELYETAAIPGV